MTDRRHPETLDELAAQLTAWEAGETVDAPLSSANRAELATWNTRLTELSQLLRQAATNDVNPLPGLDDVVARLVQLPFAEPSRAVTSPAIALPRDFGPYQILAPLGAGGMGLVYRAVHRRLNKSVALKMLPERSLLDPNAVARFDREMQILGGLQHPHIVTALDAGACNGVPYLAMELLEGLDVATVAHRLIRIPLADACEIARQAALGLQHAAGSGIVHRDVKPGNLMLTEAGVVKILDLGLARGTETLKPRQSELTSTGQVLGSIDYLSPEQAAGTTTLDLRTDIYSLGVTLFRLLSGASPFTELAQGSLLERLKAIEQGTLAAQRSLPAETPAKLTAFIRRMMHRDRECRPANWQVVIDELTPFTAGAQLTSLFVQAQQIVDRRELQAAAVVGSSTSRSSWWLGLPLVLASASLTGVWWAASGRLPWSATSPTQALPTTGSRTAVDLHSLYRHLLSTGSKITAKIDGKEVFLDSQEQLPNQPLEVFSIHLAARSDADVRRLTQIPRLNAVMLYHAQVTDACTADIARIPGLSRLDLQWATLTDRALPALAAAIELNSLGLDGRQLTEFATSWLQTQPAIQNLALEEVADEHLQRAAPLSQLRGLAIARSPGLTSAGWQHLARCTQLVFLSVQNSSLNDGDLKAVAAAPQLQHLELISVPLSDAGLEHLSAMTSLKHLQIRQTQITPGGLNRFRSMRPEIKVDE